MARGRKTGGRQKGTPNKSTTRRRLLLEAINADDKQIIDKVIADAKDGDDRARQLYFRFLRPRPRGTFTPPIPNYTKPESIEAARARILELGHRLAKGEISIETHDSLIGGLRAYLSDKAVEQQHLLEEYEAARDGLRDPHRQA
jgi:hypothetical protein